MFGEAGEDMSHLQPPFSWSLSLPFVVLNRDWAPWQTQIGALRYGVEMGIPCMQRERKSLPGNWMNVLLSAFADDR